MATILLIRHCEPEVRGVLLGQLDSALSAAGQEHAEAALSGIEVAATWCSPLLRARETAQHIRCGKHIVLDGLREISCGEWTGKTWAAIEAGWGEMARRKSADWLGVTAPGGESWPDFMNRLAEAWATIRNGPMPAAVVAHQGVNAGLANLMDGRDPLAFAQQYGEVIRVEYD
jgi:broad specificity phosphatase PhoE